MPSPRNTRMHANDSATMRNQDNYECSWNWCDGTPGPHSVKRFGRIDGHGESDHGPTVLFDEHTARVGKRAPFAEVGGSFHLMANPTNERPGKPNGPEVRLEPRRLRQYDL